VAVAAGWTFIAVLCALVAGLDAVGAGRASREGRTYSFGSWTFLPPGLIILGVMSIIGDEDSWMFSTGLGVMLLVSGPAVVALLYVRSRRAVEVG